jgi:hypothetical protein
VVLCDPIVNVKGFSELVDVTGFATEEIDDLTPICPASGSSENIP